MCTCIFISFKLHVSAFYSNCLVTFSKTEKVLLLLTGHDRPPGLSHEEVMKKTFATDHKLSEGPR